MCELNGLTVRTRYKGEIKYSEIPFKSIEYDLDQLPKKIVLEGIFEGIVCAEIKNGKLILNYR